MKGLAAMLVLWLGGIGGGFLLAGHEPRISNFLTAANAQSGGAGTEAVAASAGASGSSITVKEKDFSFDPMNITAPAGKITFHLQNWGRYTHDFRIHEPDGTVLPSGRLGAGFARDFTVTLKPGTYPFDCAVSNHAKRGMKGTLTVAA